MAELAAKNLNRRNVKRILFANRSYEHSVEFAQLYGGLPIPMNQIDEYLREADIVLVSTAAPHFVITRKTGGVCFVQRKTNSDVLYRYLRSAQCGSDRARTGGGLPLQHR